MIKDLPKKYKHQELEAKWKDYWDEEEIHHWDPNKTREETFSIDTPPPTVSGSLHIGHVFSYTQTDIIARYQRMQGKNIFYPMGWDDNGLPTERRVQNSYGITCNPKLPYNPTWKPLKTQKEQRDYEEVSRENFIEACLQLTQEDEAVFEALWRHLGLSVDWQLQYESISKHSRLMSQKSFLDLVEKDLVESHESPTMWDVDFQTAVAQAEVEDRERPSAYHDIEFKVEDGDSFVISTTRPELLPACIAVVAHPEDERYKDFFGKHAITPLFQARVPILPAEHADPEKGTGILMVCSFGDAMDVDFWKQSSLPIKQVIGRNGTLIPVTFGDAPFESGDAKAAQSAYDELVGSRAKRARKYIVEQLREAKVLVKEPEEMLHPVKFYEKGDSPLEFLSTRQWFVKILAHKKDLLKQGEKIHWHPEFMKTRYDNWVEGLNQDWCISRQRFFGIPFPVWYPVLDSGEINYEAPIFAKTSQLPVDPLTDMPEGYEASQRNQPGGFAGDPDVMDTWATSSLTPQIMSHWGLDEKRHNSVFPMDIRPQSHEIIRTWAFYTITKAWMHEEKIPWKHVAISGWVLDPDRKKMSKSKGNVVTPEHLLEEYSSDAVRYWSAKARLGADTAFEETVFTIGRKLVTKLFNASKFVMMQLQDTEALSTAEITVPVDLAVVSELKTLIEKSTSAFEKFDYAGVLENTEQAFWQFCDHYIELVKGRSYREEDLVKKRSALATLDWALSVFLRLFAPVIPYVTEEIWSWRYEELFQTRSIHKNTWPRVSEVDSVAEAPSPKLLPIAIQILSEVRGAKTTAQKNMKHPVSQLTLKGSEKDTEVITLLLEDLYRACSIEEHTLETVGTDTIDIDIVLAD